MPPVGDGMEGFSLWHPTGPTSLKHSILVPDLDKRFSLEGLSHPLPIMGVLTEIEQVAALHDGPVRPRSRARPSLCVSTSTPDPGRSLPKIPPRERRCNDKHRHQRIHRHPAPAVDQRPRGGGHLSARRGHRRIGQPGGTTGQELVLAGPVRLHATVQKRLIKFPHVTPIRPSISVLLAAQFPIVCGCVTHPTNPLMEITTI